MLRGGISQGVYVKGGGGHLGVPPRGQIADRSTVGSNPLHWYPLCWPRRNSSIGGNRRGVSGVMVILSLSLLVVMDGVLIYHYRSFHLFAAAAAAAAADVAAAAVVVVVAVAAATTTS